MSFYHPLLSVVPEIAVLFLGCAILLVDLYLRADQKGINSIIASVGLLIAIVLTLSTSVSERAVFWGGNFVRDPMSDLLDLSILVLCLLSLAYAKRYLRERGLLRGEYYALVLFATLGMLVMVSANSLVSLYLGLELLALCLYALVAFDRDEKRGSEAAMKYFVLGALGSGLLLYGMSMLYGATGGSVALSAIARAVIDQPFHNHPVLVFGLVFLVVGIAFKFGAVPFHMWVPDVYEGAPNPVVLFLGSVPKIAAFAFAVRLLVEGLGNLQAHWQEMLMILSVLSLALGNLIAIAQTNLKRMLAYSTISHVGFLFLGFIGGASFGYASAMFYAIVYALMAAGAFGVLVLLSHKGFEAENLADLRGLNDRDPWYAAMMALLLFSMAGVPPAVGFIAKLLVLQALVGAGLWQLAVVAVFFSVIGAFYYLRVIKIMYFDAPLTKDPVPADGTGRTVLSLNSLAVLFLGLFPASLLSLCQAAFG